MLITETYGPGAALLQVRPGGYKEVWSDAKKNARDKSFLGHWATPIYRDGHIYGSNEGQLTCLDFKTGTVKWEDRKPGKGSIAVADGQVYYRNEGGPVVLADATPAGYTERGRFTPPDRSGKPAWPHPILANGKLLIRDQQNLYCYDVKQK